jgi:hypothetical protein
MTLSGEGRLRRAKMPGVDVYGAVQSRQSIHGFTDQRGWVGSEG